MSEPGRPPPVYEVVIPRSEDVVVHTRRDDRSLPRHVAFAPGVTVEHVDAGPPEPIPKDDLLPHMAAFADGLHRSWYRRRPDAAHAHFWMSGLAGQAQALVATTRHEAAVLRSMGAPATSVHHVPCGVDLGQFRPDGPEDPPRRGRPRIVVVSRMVRRKGVGVGDRVEFLGALPRTAVPPLLRSADVVACCPWYEPFGLVAVEAMACGRPVVATAVGGLAETVEPGRTGWHVPARDVGAVAAALHEALADGEHRRSFGRRAAEAAAAYDWDAIAARTLAVIHLTIERQGRPVGERS